MALGLALNIQHAPPHLLSPVQHEDVINEHLQRECSEGRMLGPWSPEKAPLVQVSRFGAIPTKNQQGRWCLITDLSSPQGHSVNDRINPALCSLTYTSVDDAAAEVCAMGRGTLLAKLDIKNAYRIVPVHPEDHLLLGTKWEDIHRYNTAIRAQVYTEYL